MKLKIDGEYKEVGFWSFMKCNVLTMFVFSLIFYGSLTFIFFLIGVFVVGGVS